MLLSPEQIRRYNETLLAQLGARAHLYDLARFRDGISNRQLTDWIRETSLPEGALFCEGGAPLTGEMRQHWTENCALPIDGTPAPPQWAICTRRTALRILPTSRSVTRSSDDRYDDLLQESALLPGEPLVLLHSSADRRFSYAACRFARGWVPVDDVALCPSYDAWISAWRMDDFLLVTASHFRLEPDPYAPGISRYPLWMGMRLRLAAPPGSKQTLRHRMSWDSFLVALPVRRENGMLTHMHALVPAARDVHVGYLPYRRDLLLAQAEKLRGEVYGWGGMLEGRDCSALVMDLFRCFGFHLPRSSSDLARLPGRKNVDLTGRTPEEKRRILLRQPPGALLYFPGHIMLYCGAEHGTPFCISAAGHFAPPGAAGGAALPVNTVARTPLDVVRRDGRTWLRSLTKIIRIE